VGPITTKHLPGGVVFKGRMERAKGPLNGSGELTYPDGSTYSGDVQKA